MRRVPVVVLLVLAAACSSDEPSEPRASPTPAGHVIAGTLALAHEGTGNGWTYDRQGLNDGPKLGDVCWGEGGHSDIAEGADVTVTDGGGDILALGALGPGTLDEAFPGGSDWDQYGPFGLACVFEFEVADVPDSDFYAVEVSHRGELRYSRDELEASDWSVAFSLGE